MSDGSYTDDDLDPNAPDGPDVEHFIVGGGPERLLAPDPDAIVDDVDVDPEAVIDETDIDPEVAGRRDEGDPV